MKPSIGRKVYCIYEYSILAEPVYAVSKDTFLLTPYGRKLSAIEWFYDDYNNTWFTSLSKAKKKLLSNYQERYGFKKCKIVKLYEDYYEIQ